ncbi:MAG: M48 family metalloprotease [Thermoguttaceae bacterium]|nr:M48 family metalloprotease [Thermoguttaceae bacterium]
MNFTWKDWQFAQRMIDLYNQHRFLYYLYLLWLMFQSLLAFAILVIIVVFLFVASINYKESSIAIFTIICLISWAIGYFSSIMSNPCKGMFLVNNRKYPQIYNKVNEISRKIKGPKIHRIYIFHQFNAAATNRFLFTPFKRNILILGYPLLAALSYRGLVGCLAHEIGHIKHKHMSGSAWIMMTNAFWSNIHLGILTYIFVPWLRYWLPTFNKATIPLYRQHEIEADKYIVKTFGEDYLAACQVEMLLKEEQNSDVVDELLAQMQSDSWDQCDIPKLIRDGLREDLSEDRDERVISRAMKSVPNVFDEHPSFAQRLELADCRYPMRFAQFNADALDELVGRDDEFDSELNAHFHAMLDEYAATVRAEAEHCRQELEQNPPSVDTMTESDLIDALYYFEKTGQKTEQLKLLEQCVNAFPNFLQFRAMLALERSKDDPDGAAAELEDCISQAPELYQLDENNFLLQYYMDSGDVEKIHAFLDLKDGRIQQLTSLTQKKLDANDVLEAAPLPQDIKDFLVDAFKKKYSIVNRAYFVRRLLNDKTAIGQSFIVLDSVRSFIFTNYSMKDAVRELSEAFAETPYIIITCKTKFCDEHLETIPGARFYSKK